MRNKIVIILVSIAIILVVSLIILKANPPLQSSGQSSNVDVNPFVIVAELENKGFADIKLKEVLVNSNDDPKKVELGVSRSNGLITITEVRDASNGISFHNISEYPIKTPPESEYEYEVFDTIRHYGIVVYNDKDIKNIIVKYNYMGIPFEKEIAVGFSED